MKRYYTNAFDSHVFEHPEGPFVLYAEHAARVKELEADLADARLIAREQEDAHVAANMRCSALAIELAEALQAVDVHFAALAPAPEAK